MLISRFYYIHYSYKTFILHVTHLFIIFILDDVELILTIEDQAHSVNYWQDVFNRLPAMKPFRVIRITTATIDYHDTTSAPSDILYSTYDIASYKNDMTANPSLEPSPDQLLTATATNNGNTSRANKILSTRIDITTGYEHTDNDQTVTSINPSLEQLQLMDNNTNNNNNNSNNKAPSSPSKTLLLHQGSGDIENHAAAARLSMSNLAVPLHDVNQRLLERDSTIAIIADNETEFDGLVMDKSLPLVPSTHNSILLNTCNSNNTSHHTSKHTTSGIPEDDDGDDNDEDTEDNDGDDALTFDYNMNMNTTTTDTDDNNENNILFYSRTDNKLFLSRDKNSKVMSPLPLSSKSPVKSVKTT